MMRYDMTLVAIRRSVRDFVDVIIFVKNKTRKTNTFRKRSDGERL